MTKLNEHHKTFIVQQLACGEYPSDVVKFVKEAFDGVDVTKQQVEYYDPTKRAASNGLPEKWRKLYWKTREEFTAESHDKGIGNLSYRLARLEQWANKAAAVKNYNLAGQLLKQAAEDKGGLYTNRRNIKVNAREALAALIGVQPDDLPANPSDGSNVKS